MFRRLALLILFFVTVKCVRSQGSEGKSTSLLLGIYVEAIMKSHAFAKTIFHLTD